MADRGDLNLAREMHSSMTRAQPPKQRSRKGKRGGNNAGPSSNRFASASSGASLGYGNSNFGQPQPAFRATRPHLPVVGSNQDAYEQNRYQTPAAPAIRSRADARPAWAGPLVTNDSPDAAGFFGYQAPMVHSGQHMPSSSNSPTTATSSATFQAPLQSTTNRESPQKRAASGETLYHEGAKRVRGDTPNETYFPHAQGFGGGAPNTSVGGSFVQNIGQSQTSNYFLSSEPGASGAPGAEHHPFNGQQAPNPSFGAGRFEFQTQSSAPMFQTSTTSTTTAQTQNGLSGFGGVAPLGFEERNGLQGSQLGMASMNGENSQQNDHNSDEDVDMGDVEHAATSGILTGPGLAASKHNPANQRGRQSQKGGYGRAYADQPYEPPYGQYIPRAQQWNLARHQRDASSTTTSERYVDAMSVESTAPERRPPSDRTGPDTTSGMLCGPGLWKSRWND